MRCFLVTTHKASKHGALKRKKPDYYSLAFSCNGGERELHILIYTIHNDHLTLYLYCIKYTFGFILFTKHRYIHDLFGGKYGGKVNTRSIQWK